MWIHSAWASSEPDPRRLTDEVVPVFQRVALELDPAAVDGYRGQVDIEVEVRAEAGSIVLHAEGLDVGPCLLWRRGLGVGRPEVLAQTQEGPRLRLSPRRPLSPGRYTVQLGFRNDWESDVGLYRHVSADGHAYVVTQLEADEARTAWPVFDEPRFKLPWELVIGAPADQVVLTVGERSQRLVDGELQRVVAHTPPLSSYLVAVAVGPFVATPFADGAPGSVWTLPGRESGAAFVATVAPRHLAFLEGWFGRPSPYPRADILAVPRFTYGAMENPGLVVGREDVFLVGPDATVDERRSASAVTAHELAHYWFGDLVTLAWWDELWLNESFADWLAARSESAVSDAGLDAERQLLGAAGSLAGDALPSARPLTAEVDPDHVFETVNLGQAYTKGGAVLDAIEAWLGPEVFRAGIRALVEEHAEGVVTGADVVAALSEASGTDVGPMFVPWVTAPGAPRLDFARDADGRWSVAVSRYGRPGEPAPWTIPLRVRTDEGRTIAVSVRGTHTELPGLDGARWVFPTPGGVGYFVWSAPVEAMRALVEAPDALSPLEQLAVVTDLARLREVGALDLGQELGLLASLTPATPTVASEALGPWEVMAGVAPRSRRAEVAAALRAELGPGLARLGLAATPGEPGGTETVRRRLVSLLGGTGEDAAVRAEADRVIRAWLAGGPTPERDLLGTWATLAGRGGDDALQASLVERLRAERDPAIRSAILEGIASTPTESGRARALALALDEPGLDPGERLQVVYGVFWEEERHDARLDWAIAHHDALVAFVPPPFRMYLANLAGGCDPARLARGRAFYAGRTDLPGVEQVLADAEAAVTACVDRRARERPEVEAWLDARR
jgi:alanyl aminopeptidase